MIMNLIPASTDYLGVQNTVESHILERNKYRHKFPTLESKLPDISGSIEAINKLKYNWKFGHAPTPPSVKGAGAQATITFKHDTVSSENYDALLIEITSTDGVTKFYLFDVDGSGATGTLTGHPYVFVQLQGKSGKSAVAQELQAAINHANGHNAGSANSVIRVTESGVC